MCRAYGAKGKVIDMFFRLVKIVLPLAGIALCLFGYVLHFQSGIFREFEAVFLSVEWMLLVCMVIWCGTFIFLSFSLKDWPLIGLLLIAIAAYFIGYTASSRAADAIILLAGVTLGRWTRFALEADGRWQMADGGEKEVRSQKSEARFFLIGLIGLLAFSSWWHLDMSGAYHGPRWMGLWDNPNIYGMLMGVGTILAIALLVLSLKSIRLRPAPARQEVQSPKLNKATTIFLTMAIAMMGVGLVMSYSRGAWVGTTIGLLYLAKAHGKLKWRWVLPGVLVAVAVVCVFWHSTPDNAPWYLKRADLSRPSAQHRVSAWRGALQMMRDHPLGVGWNQAVSVYNKDYSPPEGGVAALTMNSYLMLGTELGLPGLICFVAYVGLRLGIRSWKSADGTGIVCRAGTLALLVAFWFDGGLFTLATASAFWILLEVGTSDLPVTKTCSQQLPASKC